VEQDVAASGRFLLAAVAQAAKLPLSDMTKSADLKTSLARFMDQALVVMPAHLAAREYSTAVTLLTLAAAALNTEGSLPGEDELRGRWFEMAEQVQEATGLSEEDAKTLSALVETAAMQQPPTVDLSNINPVAPWALEVRGR